ncbi:MAG: class I SAM-dependent rRNA methyltransferase [Gammaproteobacteria bacterium]|nr:class I SAM-dependent rRNA methyltransferase [Gammaproteobacteria bacterium]
MIWRFGQRPNGSLRSECYNPPIADWSCVLSDSISPTEATELAPLRLKKNEERRLRAGHLWVYSNEVDTKQTPLTAFEPGQLVMIEASNGKSLGTGYVNPHSLICARLVSRDPAHALSKSLLVHRLNVALALRERLYDKPYYRLVHGEGDALPGLVVDRYGDVLVVQLTTAGMERAREAVIEALHKVIKPTGILMRNDSPIRVMEGLENYIEAIGDVPDTLDLEENGVRFRVSAQSGQKTGWFYDQRENRARLFRYVKGMRVLDLFSYVGGWGVQAAVAGAREVTCVDASHDALMQVAVNAELNAVQSRVLVRKGDAFDVLRELREAREHFDVIVLDPPAFIKRRKDAKAGLEAYQRINQQAMQVLTKDGILVSASCSYHLEASALQQLVLAASRHVDRSMQILERGRQGADHPMNPAIPETEYLKALYCRVLPA